MTLHCAFSPQVPMHGSVHFSEIQASFDLHSEFEMHSGLQLGGTPLISGRHEHVGRPSLILHKELRPQGLGAQGF